jgi:hypothetical protein
MSTSDPAGPGHNPARRQALTCLAAWTGAAVVWTVAGGVPRALGATSAGTPTAAAKNALTFVQISDTISAFARKPIPTSSAVPRDRHNALSQLCLRRAHRL